MAQHKQAEKRHRQSITRHARNQGRKSALRTIVRHVQEALADGKIEEAKTLVPEAIKKIQKTASAGVIHKRNASRRVSRLMLALNKATAGK